MSVEILHVNRSIYSVCLLSSSNYTKIVVTGIHDLHSKDLQQYTKMFLLKHTTFLKRHTRMKYT